MNVPGELAYIYYCFKISPVCPETRDLRRIDWHPGLTKPPPQPPEVGSVASGVFIGAIEPEGWYLS
jgi:hypothetical protein